MTSPSKTLKLNFSALSPTPASRKQGAPSAVKYFSEICVICGPFFAKRTQFSPPQADSIPLYGREIWQKRHFLEAQKRTQNEPNSNPNKPNFHPNKAKSNPIFTRRSVWRVYRSEAQRRRTNSIYWVPGARCSQKPLSLLPSGKVRPVCWCISL